LSFGGGRNVRTPVISFLKRRKKRRRGRDERRGEEGRGEDRTGQERRGEERKQGQDIPWPVLARVLIPSMRAPLS
jgi:hypothetical protein